MRTIITLAMFACAIAPCASAQTNDPPVAAVDANSIDAGRELFAAIAAGDHVLDLVEQQARDQVPMRVAALRASPAFQQLTPQHQAALIATFEDVPRVFRAEFGRELELISQRVAPRFARVMSACELVAVADAIQAPETQPLLQEMVLRGISGEPTESAFPDLSRTDAGGAFLATPIGIHFLEVRSELDQIVAEESRSIATLGGRMGTLGMAMACDALEDECPATTRQRLGRQ